MNRAIANLTRPGALKEFGLRVTVMLAALKLYDVLHDLAVETAARELADEQAFLAAAEVHLDNHPDGPLVVERLAEFKAREAAAAPVDVDQVER